MSWWGKLLGRATPEQTGKTTFPACRDLVPGKLSARVHLHDMATGTESVPCWTYVTDGLSALKQKEVIFTLRRGRNERVDRFPVDPFHLFSMLYQLAGQGQLVDAGGFTQFGPRAFFGRHLAYLEPQPLPGVPLPRSAVVAMLVTFEELRALQEFGPTRLMSRFGQTTLHYPYPPWSDRLRRGLPFERTLRESLLMKVARGNAAGVGVCQTSNRIVMTISRHNQGGWRQRLHEVPTSVPIALLTDLQKSADGCLVWEPGQVGPTAITPPGSQGLRLGGCFVLFVPEQMADGGRILEDGFAVTLTTPSWEAVRRALIDGHAISVPSTGDGLSLSLEWQDEVYVNPIDQKAYIAPGGWKKYQPEPSRATEARVGNVKMERIGLLTAEADIAGRATTEDFIVFCEAVERCAGLSLEGSQGAFKVLVQFRCTPAGHQIQMAHQGDAEAQFLQAFSDSLATIPHLPVMQGDVTFQAEFAVSPSSAVG